MNAITEVKIRRKSKKPILKLRCTISKMNYLELKNYVKFWKDKVDSMYFQPIVDNAMNRIRDKSLLFTRENEASFRNILSELQVENSFLRNIYYTFMSDYVFNRKELYERLKYKCLLVSSSTLDILPDGSVVVCYGRRQQSISNALNEDIVDIWKSEGIKQLRRKIKETICKEYYPDCFCWDPHTIFNLYIVIFYNFVKKIVK